MSNSSTLVVSDLHLRVGLSEKAAQAFQRLLAETSADLLVINGDFFDLDWIEEGREEETPMERCGRILDAFPGVIDSLQRFGGRIVWLCGNHDAEVALPEVQDALRRRLGIRGAKDLCFAESFEQSGMHVEHGHQFDPDNRFCPDTARAVATRRLSALPLGCLVTRTLLCRIPDYANREDNHRTPLQVLLRVLRRHGLGTVRMVALYILSSVRIALLAHSVSGFFRVLRRMYLDRIAECAALVLLLLLTLIFTLAAQGFTLLPATTAIAASVPCALLLLLPPRRREYQHRDRRGCREGAMSLFGRGAQLVILGHTHHPDAFFESGCAYLNPGAFHLPHQGGHPFVLVRGGFARLDFVDPAG